MSLDPSPQTEPDGARRSARFLAAFTILYFLGWFAAIVFGDPVQEFMLASLQVLPFAALALLAYLGIRRTWALVLAVLWQIALLVSFSALLFFLTLMLFVLRSRGMVSGPGTSPGDGSAGGWGELGAVALFCAGGLATAAIVALPSVRRAIAQRLPIDWQSPVHTLALSLVVGMTVTSLGHLFALGGKPLVLELLKADPRFAAEISKEDMIASTLYGLAWTIPCALAAVGYPVARTAREALRRLGFVWPTPGQVLLGIGMAVLMVGFGYLLDWGIGSVWKVARWPQTESEYVEKLFSSLTNPLGAVVIGITAGVGEELAVRGVLQPRLGILLSNLFFTSLHALQYSFDGLLSVFLVGLVLGIIRQRTNTTTACIVHGLYDFILVMISVLYPGQ
jgi:membrane protease YdiL (CAAX protease family)